MPAFIVLVSFEMTYFGPMPDITVPSLHTSSNGTAGYGIAVFEKRYRLCKLMETQEDPCRAKRCCGVHT